MMSRGVFFSDRPALDEFGGCCFPNAADDIASLCFNSTHHDPWEMPSPFHGGLIYIF